MSNTMLGAARGNMDKIASEGTAIDRGQAHMTNEIDELAQRIESLGARMERYLLPQTPATSAQSGLNQVEERTSPMADFLRTRIARIRNLNDRVDDLLARLID